MRLLLSLILASIILLQSTSDLFIYLNYQINKEYISEILCVNKDDPDSSCNGKCFLRKSISQGKDDLGSLPQKILENHSKLTLFLQQSLGYIKRLDLHFINEINTQSLDRYKYLFTSKILDPPKVFLIK